MTSARAVHVLGVLVLSALPVFAQQQRDRDLERVRQEIAQLRDRLAQIHARSRSAEDDLQAAEVQIDIDTRELRLALDSQAGIIEQQRRVEQEIGALSGRLEVQKRELSRRLVALYKMGPLSYFRLVSSIDTRQNPVQAAAMLTYLISRDARSVSAYEQSTRQLAGEREALIEKTRQVQQATTMVAARQRQLEQTRRQKAVLLASLQSEEHKTARKLEELEEKARRLENLVALLYGRVDPNAPRDARIDAFKGALYWPLRGRVLEGFGRQRNPKFATVTSSNGLKIEGPVGSEVRTIFQGTVLFSQWFKGYGNLIILDHGNKIFSLYGNTIAPRVSVGDRVETQQVIAAAAANDENTSGFLYFEVREDNKPVDPRTWLR